MVAILVGKTKHTKLLHMEIQKWQVPKVSFSTELLRRHLSLFVGLRYTNWFFSDQQLQKKKKKKKERKKEKKKKHGNI